MAPGPVYLPVLRSTEAARIPTRPTSQHTPPAKLAALDSVPGLTPADYKMAASMAAQLPTQGKKGDGKLHFSSLILPGGFESAVCFEIACDS